MMTQGLWIFCYCGKNFMKGKNQKNAISVIHEFVPEHAFLFFSQE